MDKRKARTTRAFENKLCIRIYVSREWVIKNETGSEIGY